LLRLLDVDVGQWNALYELGDNIDPLADQYQPVLDILGPTGVILSLGDSFAEVNACPSINPELGWNDSETFTTIGADEFVYTWSENVVDLDTTPSFQDSVPVVELNGTDEYATLNADDSYWTVNDSGGAGFSVGAWVNLAGSSENTILAKFDATGNKREWLFRQGSLNKLTFTTYDESENKIPYRDADLGTSIDAWHFVLATYDGSGGGTNQNGTKLYQDGELWASRAHNNGDYVAMEDLAGKVTLGYYDSTPTSLFDGKLAGGPLGPFFTHVELSASQIHELYELGREALGLP